MQVLISIENPVAQWTIPDEQVARLRHTFPDIKFLLVRHEGDATAAIADADVAFTWRLTPELLHVAGRLRWVHTSAVAAGTLMLPELAARGVQVTNSRGIQSGSMADHAMGMLLALARKLHLCVRAQADARWIQGEVQAERAPWTLAGRQMAIVGTGTVGTAIATRARAFGTHVVGVRRHTDRPRPPAFNVVVGVEALHDALRASDVLVLALPLTVLTRRLIGARELALLPPHGIVINVGRGQLLDDEALVAALDAGRIGGAGLDVFAHEPLEPASPYWRLPNVIVSPHISGFRADHWDAVIALFEDNLRRFLQGEELLNPVDPEEGY